MNKIPTYDELMRPLLNALKLLGGSGSIDEIYEKVVEKENIPETIISKLHDPDKSNQTEIQYRLAWARTYLKKFGLLENSVRGIWSLTNKAKQIDKVDPQEVVRIVKHNHRKEKEHHYKKKKKIDETIIEDTPEETETWREKLHLILTKKLDADSFERLTQRLLRESGFVQVEITGRTGDGGKNMEKELQKFMDS